MQRIFLIKIPLLFCLGVFILAACKKNNFAADNGSSGLDSNGTVAITPVGTPVGSPVSKSIGTAGGTLTSSDGVLVLTIPAGALTTATNITIQPVTSQMPDSLGLGYNLLPNGTKFNVPVTLTFHYTADQFPNNNPEFSTVAYQDASGAWVSDPINRDFDTSAKTVSLDVSHFTIFEMGEWLTIRGLFPRGDVFHGGDKAILFVAYTFWEKGRVTVFDQLKASQVESWQVNDIVGGSSTDGTISQLSGLSSATYQAPARIPQKRTVIAKCVTKIHELVFKKGKQIQDNLHLTAYYPLYLVPDPEYNLTVTYYLIDSTLAPDFSKDDSKPGVPVYKDSVKFDINLKVSNGEWTSNIPTSSIVNGAPTVTPSTASRSIVTWTWTPDLTGELNVTSVVGRDGDLPADSIVSFDVFHKGALLPGWIETSIVTGKLVQTVPTDPYPAESGAVTYLEIDLKKIPYSDPEGAIGQWNITKVTKRN